MSYDVPAEDVAMMNKAVFGEKPKVVARFYERDGLDVLASREAQTRVMVKRVYLHAKCEKERSEINRPMQEIDKRRYAEAWQAFTEGRMNERLGQIQDICAERPSIGAGFAKAQKG